MQGVGFEGFARVALGDDIQRAGAGHVNGEGEEKNQDGGDAWLNMDGAKEKAIESFVNDVNGGEDEQTRFNECRKIFELAVAVGVALVGWLIGDAHGEKRDDCSDQVEAGVQSFGKDAEAVCANDQEGFQTKEKRGGADAQQGGTLLFLDGGLKASGKDHGVRLQHVGRGC